MKHTSTRVLLSLCIVAAVIATWLWYLQHRKTALRDLRDKAIGVQIVGGDGAVAAIHSIAADVTPEATQTLISIASQPDNQSLPSVRKAAVDALAERSSRDVANYLAALLQPFESVEVRDSAAHALERQPCTVEASSRILYYEERMYAGEWASEDVPNFPAAVRDQLNNDRRQLAKTLDSTLLRCESETNAALAGLYGFGTLVPSRYGMQWARETRYRASCPSLLASAEQLSGLTEINTAITEALQQTLDQLGCQRGSGDGTAFGTENTSVRQHRQ